jgi:hypothetical protein
MRFISLKPIRKRRFARSDWQSSIKWWMKAVGRLLEAVTEFAKKWLNDGYDKKVKIEIRLQDFDDESP